jgi:hypothetical protein
VPHSSLVSAARELADRLLAAAPLAARATKEVARRAPDMSAVDAIRFGETMRLVVHATQDARKVGPPLCSAGHRYGVAGDIVLTSQPTDVAGRFQEDPSPAPSKGEGGGSATSGGSGPPRVARRWPASRGSPDGHLILVIEPDPWPMLTLIVSLEAIFLSTFAMIG